MRGHIPYVVYHYTSLETLLKIIENKTLRLSDITKSNDYYEVRWILTYIEKVFRQAHKAERSLYFKRSISEEIWVDTTKNMIEKWFNPKESFYSYFVCCFSKESDMLSQWRGYANDAKGIAIGFDSRVLNGYIKICPGTELVDVIYSKKQQQKSVREVADSLIKKVKDHIKIKNGISKNELEALFDEAFMQLLELAIMMKKPFFKEEKEVRLCYLDIWRNEDDKKNRENKEQNNLITPKRYFATDNNISSYVDFYFGDTKEIDYKGLIRSVWRGPKCNASEEDIKLVLKHNGFEEIKVNKSDGSYRETYNK